MEQSSSFQLHQCLFGYKDGHRLLASSIKLESDVETKLLRYSDLAPGVSEITKDGYWTGLPIESQKNYALLHTWRAPEMPRPGCVWTHVIFIGFADIARFSNLSILQNYFIRPEKDSSFENYKNKVTVDLPILSAKNPFLDNEKLSSIILALLRTIYTNKSEPFEFYSGAEFDEAVYRVWSQQWPRLRRNFSFRTIASSQGKFSSEMQFDFQLHTGDFKQIGKREDISSLPLEPWENVALKDALSLDPTSFRKFIWRYGSEISKGKEKFAFLANVFLEANNGETRIDELEKLVNQIETSLPGFEEGKSLKIDLVAGDSSKFSLLPAFEIIDIIKILLSHPYFARYFCLLDSLPSLLSSIWSTRMKDIIDVAELAIKKKSNLQEMLVGAVSSNIDTKSFFKLTNKHVNLQKALIKENPNLLNSDLITSVGLSKLYKLIELLPKSKKYASQVVNRLMTIDDSLLAETVSKKYPKLVIENVVEIVETQSKSKDLVSNNAWLELSKEYVNYFVEGKFVSKSKTTRALAFYSKHFGYDNKRVLEEGPLPWAKALQSVEDNLKAKEKREFCAFLLMLAIKYPCRGSEPIFEYSFEPIHKALAKSSLEYEARLLVKSSFHNMFWWNEWDLCRHLRTRVIYIYLKYKLDLDSFTRLAKDRKLSVKLKSDLLEIVD